MYLKYVDEFTNSYMCYFHEQKPIVRAVFEEEFKKAGITLETYNPETLSLGSSMVTFPEGKAPKSRRFSPSTIPQEIEFIPNDTFSVSDEFIHDCIAQMIREVRSSGHSTIYLYAIGINHIIRNDESNSNPLWAVRFHTE